MLSPPQQAPRFSPSHLCPCLEPPLHLLQRWAQALCDQIRFFFFFSFLSYQKGLYLSTLSERLFYRAVRGQELEAPGLCLPTPAPTLGKTELWIKAWGPRGRQGCGQYWSIWLLHIFFSPKSLQSCPLGPKGTE